MTGKNTVNEQSAVDTASAQKDIVALLRHPSGYPEPTCQVSVRETHMSWVFLTDQYAYKLKKPLRYAYLDFSTAEARYRNCEAEVRLNRRLAPDIYLGVIGVNAQDNGALTLGPVTAESRDFLVEMRRLPTERSLDHLLAQHAVEEADILRLAHALSDFYRRANRIDLTPEYYRQRFANDIWSDTRELIRYHPHLDKTEVQTLSTGLEAFLASHGALLDERIRQRRIVEAHGDLRPEHVYLLPRPVIIDCLEFNRELRILDPVDELAFLAMECARHEAVWVGRVLLRSYCSESGDPAPRALVGFYMAYRALLWAKLAAWHLERDSHKSSAQWLSEVRSYLKLGRQLLADTAPW